LPDEPHDLEAEKAKIRARIERYAERASLRLNPDKARVEEVIHGLAMRKQKYGYAYCPCRIVTGNKATDSKTVCPCAYHKEEIAERGTCVCELFVSKEEKS
jgi:ferredoxin-thioredoxin reductase catalytic subunit